MISTTEPSSETTIRKAVRTHYTKLALQTESCGEDCCKDHACGETQLSLAPDEAVQIAAGCGSPLSFAKILAGQTVVDLGSGGGIDVFRAAKFVGPRGTSIGVDATPEMIWRARETAAKNGYVNVEFRLGEIERIPLETNSADWVISNCVINLSPDKERVFKDAFRILKPSGHLVVSDIVAEKPIPPRAKKIMTGWARCLTGTIPEAEYLSGLAKAGFKEIQVLERRSGMNLKMTGVLSAQRLRLASLTISGRKPVEDAN